MNRFDTTLFSSCHCEEARRADEATPQGSAQPISVGLLMRGDCFAALAMTRGTVVLGLTHSASRITEVPA
jgi:hypothetical protein